MADTSIHLDLTTTEVLLITKSLDVIDTTTHQIAEEKADKGDFPLTELTVLMTINKILTKIEKATKEAVESLDE